MGGLGAGPGQELGARAHFQGDADLADRDSDSDLNDSESEAAHRMLRATPPLHLEGPGV
jgi:hypothetical protein